MNAPIMTQKTFNELVDCILTGIIPEDPSDIPYLTNWFAKRAPRHTNNLMGLLDASEAFYKSHTVSLVSASAEKMKVRNPMPGEKKMRRRSRLFEIASSNHLRAVYGMPAIVWEDKPQYQDLIDDLA